jgi:hypothetical protein
VDQTRNHSGRQKCRLTAGKPAASKLRDYSWLTELIRNAREAGDNTYPLHWAAARKNVEIVRALLDAGGDVHGFGDVHGLDTIGWTCVYREAGDDPLPVANLLVERGARHHIFSAIALGDLNLLRKLVEQDAKSLERRMSQFENGQTGDAPWGRATAAMCLLWPPRYFFTNLSYLNIIYLESVGILFIP